MQEKEITSKDPVPLSSWQRTITISHWTSTLKSPLSLNMTTLSTKLSTFKPQVLSQQQQITTRSVSHHNTAMDPGSPNTSVMPHFVPVWGPYVSGVFFHSYLYSFAQTMNNFYKVSTVWKILLEAIKHSLFLLSPNSRLETARKQPLRHPVGFSKLQVQKWLIFSLNSALQQPSLLSVK